MDNYITSYTTNDIAVTSTMELLRLLSALLLLVLPAAAQFQFFEHMFSGQGGHQQNQAQNAGSDSAWYQQRYEDGTSSFIALPAAPTIS
jgi:hypothetical protein